MQEGRKRREIEKNCLFTKLELPTSTVKMDLEFRKAIIAVKEDMAQEMRKLQEAFVLRLSGMEEKMALLVQENIREKERILNLESELERLDREKRRNNIKIKGIQAETVEEAARSVREILSTDVSNVRLITAQRGKIIIGTCKSFDEKLRIMRKKKDLHTSSGAPVYVDNDLSPKDQEIYYKARRTATELRAEGRDVRVRPRSLIVDGDLLLYDQKTDSFIHKVPRKISRATRDRNTSTPIRTINETKEETVCEKMSFQDVLDLLQEKNDEVLAQIRNTSANLEKTLNRSGI